MTTNSDYCIDLDVEGHQHVDPFVYRLQQWGIIRMLSQLGKFMLRLRFAWLVYESAFVFIYRVISHSIVDPVFVTIFESCGFVLRTIGHEVPKITNWIAKTIGYILGLWVVAVAILVALLTANSDWQDKSIDRRIIIVTIITLQVVSKMGSVIEKIKEEKAEEERQRERQRAEEERQQAKSRHQELIQEIRDLKAANGDPQWREHLYEELSINAANKVKDVVMLESTPISILTSADLIHHCFMTHGHMSSNLKIVASWSRTKVPY